MERLVSLLFEEGDMEEELIIFHGDALDRAEKLEGLIRSRAPQIKTRIEMVGPVIGIYAGPDTLGLAFKKK